MFNPRDPHESFWATIGLRIEPMQQSSGTKFEREVKSGQMPLAYYRAMEESASYTLQQGIYGWLVTDCAVYLTDLDFVMPLCTAATFRRLTWLVLMRALQAAGTTVYEPYYSLEIEVPAGVVSNLMSYLGALGATITQVADTGELWSVTAELPIRRVHDFMAALPGLAHGEGTVWFHPSTDRPVQSGIPRQERFDDYMDKYDQYLSNDDFFKDR